MRFCFGAAVSPNAELDNRGDLLLVSQEPIEFSANEMRKYFKVGDHVKSIGGRFDGDTGLVIRVDGSRVHVYSDVTNQEVLLILSFSHSARLGFLTHFYSSFTRLYFLFPLLFSSFIFNNHHLIWVFNLGFYFHIILL